MGKVISACMWKAETDGHPGAGKSAGPSAEKRDGACIINAIEPPMPHPMETAAAKSVGLLGSSLNISLW